MLASLLIGTLLATQGAAPAPFPELVVPRGWGVNIHFNDPQPGEMDLIHAGGFRWIRQDLAWNEVEKTRGVYDFSALERLFQSCRARGIRPLIILDYGNDRYQAGAPRSPEARAGFVRMVEALMAKFKGRGAIWEMWNEPNIHFWKPTPNVQEYILLAKAVGEAIRRVAPQERYIGPALAGFDWAFLESCFRAGLLNYWSAVSIHPYRSNEPESVLKDWSRLRGLVSRYAPGKEIPLLSGEWGYSELHLGIGKAKQSQYIVRQYLANLMAGVPISIWYDWKDDGDDPKEVEHHFGTMSPDLDAKETYRAAQRFARELDGFRYHLRVALTSENDYLAVFVKGTKPKLVAWTTGLPKSVRLPHDGKTYRLGPSPQVLTPVKDTATLRLIRAWKALPGTLTVGSLQEARAGDAAIRRSVPAGATIRVPPVRDDLSESVRPAKVTVTRGGVSVSQHVSVLQTRPLAIDLFAVPNALEVRLKNPERRRLNGWLTLKGASRTDRVRVNSSAAEYVHTARIGAAAAKPIRVTFASLDGAVRRELPRMAVLTLPAVGIAQNTLVMDDGDPKLPGTYQASYGDALRVRYRFPVGWKFVWVKPLGKGGAILPGKPVSLNLKVWADGTGDVLRTRFRDASGQVFQANHGPLSWNGWRRIAIPLDERAATHWGGANDGRIHHPIRIEAIVVVDALGARGGSGEFAIKDACVVTRS